MKYETLKEKIYYYTYYYQYNCIISSIIIIIISITTHNIIGMLYNIFYLISAKKININFISLYNNIQYII